MIKQVRRFIESGKRPLQLLMWKRFMKDSCLRTVRWGSSYREYRKVGKGTKDTSSFRKAGGCNDTDDRRRAKTLTVVTHIVGLLCLTIARAEPLQSNIAQASASLWGHDNLVAWCVAPWDAEKRGPEQRAQMLARLGFKYYAHISLSNEAKAEVDAEIEAPKRHGISLLAWYFPLDADNPIAKETLEAFKRHGVRPQLWVALPPTKSAWPNNQEEWKKLVPEGPPMPTSWEERENLSQADREKLDAALSKVIAHVRQQDMPKSSREQQERLAQETNRIHALVELAKPYGVKVELYNHNGWFGMMDNQVSIIENLKKRGITDVGIVYNFSHARDELHDDTVDFDAIWRKIKPYVVAVNVTGTAWERTYIYPSQGDRELEMMRTIQGSGWRGHIGLIAEKGGDAEVTLANYIKGLDWLAAELKKAGSGGPRPFPIVLSPKQEVKDSQ